MLVSVRYGALRPAQPQLRGVAQPLSAPPRAAPASRDSQREASFRSWSRGQRADEGLVVRQVAAAAESRPEHASPRGRSRLHKAADGEAAPLPRKAPPVSELTADGNKPKPDERTVAYLLRPGWFKTEKDAVTVLTRAKSGRDRYPFETASGNGAKAAADWLAAAMGAAPMKDGRCPAAQVVKSQPLLLTRDTATLQRNWDALVLSAEQGGIGIMFTQEQAREAFLKFPTILNYAADNLRSGWSMLTATEGGLGLTHDEARKCILINPQVLNSDFEKFTKRVELLRSLGYSDAHQMMLASSAVLSYKDETVIEHAVWWSKTGLDHVKLVTSYPTLLGGSSDLQAKLDFLRGVAGMSDDELSHGAPFFSASLEEKLKPRFFYAQRHGALERFKLSTLTFCTDALYLKRVHCLDAPASADAVERYKATVSSAALRVD